MRTDDNWIQTYTGRQFWPLDPRAEDVCIEDIAHALSNTCRFTGHCRFFYSVAQHSVLVCDNLRGLCRDVQMWGLMHDAAEAYLCDVATPVKRAIPGYIEHEEKLMRVIAEAFDLPWPMPQVVKNMDRILFTTERRDLMASSPQPWDGLSEPLPHGAIQQMAPDLARWTFIRRFSSLAYAY